MAVTKRNSKSKLPKIEVFRKGPKSSTDTQERIIVLINGKLKRINNRLAGCRGKLFYRNYIIKIDRHGKPYDQAKKEERLWKKLDEEDRQYFPELLYADSKEGIVIQKKLNFKKVNRISVKNRNIVRSLIKKYQLTDVSVAQRRNWGICAKTSNPIIYDFGY